ncbi:MAG: NADH dehydrogenase [uncultured Rubrobacteraceae bacterium]|uniref:NADH:ubiquinone reductase (non-electrogenic) n=1 Tax=uncultured Rubrobacteraceae bacterium TaxID=349277 RepID=A0A6J4QWX9_9ACTN|nr:MAG: NADH dehydrogenase [uncultured Rubrobacteraceae bacterium]
MRRWVKGVLAAGGAAVAAGALRDYLNPEPRYSPWERRPYGVFEKKVLVVGGGFGGYSVVEKLTAATRRRDDVAIMMLSRENFFTFWPMVAGTISSDIDSLNVAQPLRRALITAGASFRRAPLERIDHARKIAVAGGKEFPYDQLVIAVGAQPNFFGIEGVEEHCLTMKGVADAERIRNRVIERFEDATLADGDVPPSRLTFAVIGGGSTGVETAAEIDALISDALAPDYPGIKRADAKVILLTRGSEILPELDPALRRAARARLAARNVEVLTGAAAERVEADRVVLKDGREISTENAIWTAGGRPNELLKSLDLPLTERDGVIVDEYLRVEDRPGVWSLGDCAAVPNLRSESEKERFVPPTAQAAAQQGEAAAKNILATLDGREAEMEPFEYRPLGQLVELGSEFAVNEVLGVKFSGLLAALVWRATYLYKLESPRGKAAVAADWTLGLFFRPVAAEIRRD